MCGINGSNWDDRILAARMADAISHRGPDDRGVFNDRNVSLSHVRLSIIDLSKRGKQPMTDGRGNYIVFNGEIYNYKELRKELEKKGHSFSSETDTEVIVHLYREYGARCLSMLNGMFAIAIYDSAKRRIMLARDRMGIKPIYYYDDGRRFIFSSEIKAILKHRIKREVDKRAFSEFMAFRFSLAPNTLFRNIRKLQPGHYLLYPGSVKTEHDQAVKRNFISEFNKVILNLFNPTAIMIKMFTVDIGYHRSNR